MLVLGAVGDEKQEASGGKRVHEAVEPRLGLRVDPVQVLENEQQRLDLTLAEDQAPGGVERVLPALAGSSPSHRGFSTGAPRRAVSAGAAGQDLAERGEPRADPRAYVLVGLGLPELEVAPQQHADGEVARRPAVG